MESTSQTIDQQTINLAVGMARVTTRERIPISGVWLPFKLLYDELIKAKEITRLSELPEKEKLKYWRESKGVEQIKKVVSGIRIKEPEYKRMWIAQSLYVWDLIVDQGEKVKRSVATEDKSGICRWQTNK